MIKTAEKSKNIKTDLDIWFFFLFLLTFTFSIRKVWFYFPIQGTFNEYTGTYVYVSDIFLLLTIVSWLTFILYNFNNKMSMNRLWITRLFHKLFDLSTLIKSNPLFYLPILFIILSFLSIGWSDNKAIALFRSINLLIYYSLYLYIAIRLVTSMFHVEHADGISTSSTMTNVPRGTLSLTKQGRLIFFLIITIASVHSIIGILQISLQHSVGLTTIKESIISPMLPGVAKIAINGQKFIRAYGLMPHPNILGGFLLFSSILTLFFLKMFHVEHYMPLFSSSSNSADKTQYVPRGTLYGLLVLQLSGFLISLSKSAIIGFVLALIYIHSPNLFDLQKMFHARSLEKLKQLKTLLVKILCSTWNILMPHKTRKKSQPLHDWDKANHMSFQDSHKYTTSWSTSKQNQSTIKSNSELINNVPRGTYTEKPSQTRIYFLAALILAIITFYSYPFIISNISDSLNQRSLFQNVSRGTISAHPVIGIGIGQYIVHMVENYPYLENWQFQPVHNTFLLIWSELGIVGLGLFVFWLYKLFHVKQSIPSFIKEDFHPSEKKAQDRIGNNLIIRDTKNKNQEESILYNIYNDSSMNPPLRYFKSILLGFTFIMLFDHYFWDIQQGSFLLWMIAGFIAGIKLNCYNSKAININ